MKKFCRNQYNIWLAKLMNLSTRTQFLPIRRSTRTTSSWKPRNSVTDTKIKIGPFNLSNNSKKMTRKKMIRALRNPTKNQAPILRDNLTSRWSNPYKTLKARKIYPRTKLIKIYSSQCPSKFRIWKGKIGFCSWMMKPLIWWPLRSSWRRLKWALLRKLANSNSPIVQIATKCLNRPSRVWLTCAKTVRRPSKLLRIPSIRDYINTFWFSRTSACPWWTAFNPPNSSGSSSKPISRNNRWS